MSESDSKLHLEEDISIHIFTVSASLVGVCLTVIGIIHIVISMQNINTLADDLLAMDAFVFLCACLLSYWALRTRSKRRMHQVERIADALFLVGLVVMAVVCGLIVYALV
jgi:branched-subunit amino acid permease